MDSLRDEQAKLSATSLAILAAVAVAAVLYVARPVMIPFVLALFIASIVSPVVDYQVLRLRVPHGVAVTVALLFTLVLVSLFALVVAYSGQQLVATAGRYTNNTDQILRRFEDQLQAWIPEMDSAAFINHFINFVKDQTDKFSAELKAHLPQLLSRTFGTTVSLFTTITLVTIFAIFLLAGRDPRAVRQGILGEIDQQIRGYIATKVMLSTITGILVWVSLSLIGLDLAIVFGLLAFLLNFIPSIGSVIATLLPIPIAVVQFPGAFWHLLAVVAIPGAIQMGIGNVLEPKLMGNELKLHPVTILLALSAWGLLWGVIGMLLAVPITAVLRIVLLRFETTRPVANLLAGDLGEDTAAPVKT